MLQEYLRAEPTVPEQLSGAVQSDNGGDSRKKRQKDKAREALKKFDDAWRSASK
ncbi:hypothetical protein F4677DRAFT_406224 [Hypoxylon crocopeplum]|nr:hypothetical protein F4677DRAFT_406224 [Hypoxylon crocopeplum]